MFIHAFHGLAFLAVEVQSKCGGVELERRAHEVLEQ